MKIKNKLIIPAVGFWAACHVSAQTEPVNAASATEGVAVSTSAPALAVPADSAEKSDLTPFVSEAAPAAPAADKSNSPDTLSVDFPDEDIRSVLRNVADLFELNIVIPDALSGRTSIKLRDVTWRQLYRVVLAPFGYTFVEEGNIIKIVSQDSLMLEPFATQTLIMENVPAASIDGVLRQMLSPARPATETEPARAGGTLVINSLANEFIITDQPEVIRRMIETARRLDVEPRQVVIETKFVEISNDDSKALGVNFAGKKNVGGGSTASDIGGNTIGGKLTSSSTDFTTNFADVVAGAPGSSIVIENEDFSAILNAISEVSGTRIVSSPTIVALNGTKSKIDIGTQLQTLVTSRGGEDGNGPVTAAAGERIFTGVSVAITPQITSNKLVALNVITSKSEPIEVLFGSGATLQRFYSLNERKGELNMILRDGQTAAIGGLMDRNDQDTVTKVPVLGDIPVLGVLFRNKTKDVMDRNLIIFITANILEPSRTTYRNLATNQQLNALQLTDRDIRGVSYKPSAEEEALYEAIKELRQKEQDAELRKQLEIMANPPQSKKSK
jgi:type IV pilus assembly protein PilQ